MLSSLIIAVALGPTAPYPYFVQARGATPLTAESPGWRAPSPAPSQAPLLFIENVGQYPEQARFYLPGVGGNALWVNESGIWLTLYERPDQVAALGEADRRPEPFSERGLTLKLSFPGSNPDVRLEPFAPLNTQISYLSGPTRANWQTNIPAWGGIRYVDLYPGLDLELTGSGDDWQWRLISRQATTSTQTLTEKVRMQVDGANEVMIESGMVLLSTPLGRLALPLLETVGISGAPLDLGNLAPEVVGSQINAPYIQTNPPLGGGASSSAAQAAANFVYSTFVGGSGTDCFLNCVVALDAGGSAYLAGYTQSGDFPTTIGLFNHRITGNSDAFVVKMNPEGDGLAYATFIGGAKADFGTAIAVDSKGRAYLTGYTASTDFPTTQGALNVTYNGGFSDAFLVRLNAQGSGFDFSTLLGGSSNDRGTAIAVDRQGNAYLAGETQSTDFPTTPNAAQPTYQGGRDAFVAKIRAGGGQIDYATYLGGSRTDDARAIAIDDVGAAYLTGRTTAADFPVTANAFDARHGGQGDAYVAKLNPDGTALDYATFIGGHSNDIGNALTVDNQGQVYLVGSTLSPNFPVSADAFDRRLNEGYDAFAIKLSAAGDELLYGTLLGGSAGDRGTAVAVDNQGRAYVAGYTYSTDFPTTTDAFDAIQDSDFADAFVVRLLADGSGLTYATFLGGDAADYGTGIAVDGQGSIYLAGSTESNTFPVTRNAFDNTFNGGSDAFVTKFSLGSETSTAEIAGIVRDQAGYAIAGVVVSAGGWGSTTTDSTGTFQLQGLDDGIYTLTAIKTGYTFSPARRTVTVPSSEGLQIFTGIPAGDPPTPFLDLPFNYGDSVPAFTRALRDTDESGWVTSWFDHAYPDYAKNRNLMMWDGYARTKDGYNLSVGCYERRCYDDHNGIDLAYRVPGTGAPASGPVEVRAAAAGTVVHVRNNCVVGNRWCGGGFGNNVIIYHPEQGYFTLYGHLARASASYGPVEAGQAIGIMGTTGNSSGPHLHFGVYRDDGNGKWDGEDTDLVVDPFGWRGSDADPWVVDRQGPVSYYLWRYPLAYESIFAGQQGTRLTDATENIQVNIPPDALLGEATVELFMGSVPNAEAGVRSVGHAFWLRLLEWLPGVSNATGGTITTVDSASNRALQQPIDIAVSYSDSEMAHLDVSELTLARWDAPRQAWQTLPTNVDAATRTASGRTASMGQFDLQAPLICPADSVEPDDRYFAARSIDPGQAISRLFDIAGDEDWFYLRAQRGAIYTLQTSGLSGGADTVLEIFSSDSRTVQASNDDGGAGRASYLEWRAPADGSYFIRVSQGAGSSHGCGTGYTLSLTVRAYEMYLPMIWR